jgi:hypothetical protein
VKHDIALYNESSRNLLTELPGEAIEHTEIVLTVPATGDRISHKLIEVAASQEAVQAILNQMYRYKFMTLIREHFYKVKGAPGEVKALFGEIQKLPVRSDFQNRLAIDLIDSHPNHGQVEKAFQLGFFPK